LDACAIQRPLDDKSQIRIMLEADAIIHIIQRCEDGELELYSSDVLLYELSRITNLNRRNQVIECVNIATTIISMNDDVVQLADEYVQQGLKQFDAFHLASAQLAQVDYFCTCDDRLLKKCASLSNLTIKVVAPLTLVEEIER
jgi:predicted nucleic acid-binding protein